MGFLKQHWQKFVISLVLIAAVAAGGYYGWPLIRDILPGGDDDTIPKSKTVVESGSDGESPTEPTTPKTYNDGISPFGSGESADSASTIQSNGANIPGSGNNMQPGMGNQNQYAKNSDQDIMSSKPTGNIYNKNMNQGLNYEAQKNTYQGQNYNQPSNQAYNQNSYQSNQSYNYNSSPITLGGNMTNDYELSLIEQKIKELKLQINHLETQLKYKQALKKKPASKSQIIVIEGNQAKVYDTSYYKNLNKTQKKNQAMIKKLTQLRQSVHTLTSRVKKLEQKLYGPLNN